MEIPQYTECYVAFLDILGFKELVNKSKTQTDLRESLLRALHEAATLLPVQFNVRDNIWFTQTRAFSDSVAIFVPTEAYGLTDVLCKIRYLHDRLLELGFCLRGAVTIGGMYWNNNWSHPNRPKQHNGDPPVKKEVVYERGLVSDVSETPFITLGPGLIDAYILESEVAVYPRVILSPSLIAHINEMSTSIPNNHTHNIHDAVRAKFLCSPNPENKDRCITDFIRQDADGIPFLDLFHKDIDRKDTQRIEKEILDNGRTIIRWVNDCMTHDKFMVQARVVIEEHLKKRGKEKVCAKYLWLANYFNSSILHMSIPPLPIEWNPSKEK